MYYIKLLDNDGNTLTLGNGHDLDKTLTRLYNQWLKRRLKRLGQEGSYTQRELVRKEAEAGRQSPMVYRLDFIVPSTQTPDPSIVAHVVN